MFNPKNFKSSNKNLIRAKEFFHSRRPAACPRDPERISSTFWIPRTVSGTSARERFSKYRCAGYSLIELLVTLSLVSILLLFSLQNYQPLKIASESRTVMDRLIAMIQYGRSEAIRSGQIVTICKSRDGKTCGGRWEDGQIIFRNSTLLQKLGPIKGHLDFKAFQSADFLRFTPIGTTFEQNGHFTYCPTQDVRQAHALILEKSGQVHLSKDNDHDGVDEDAKGLPLSCTRH